MEAADLFSQRDRGCERQPDRAGHDTVDVEVFWVLRSKAVLILLQDGFETFDANNTGGCLGVIMSAPLDLFDDVVRLALGFLRDVVRLWLDASIHAIAVMSTGPVVPANRFEIFSRSVRIILFIFYVASEADVSELLRIRQLSRDGDTHR